MPPTVRLGAVGDLGAKFNAARRTRWQLVVPAANRDDIRLAPDPAAVHLAATVTAADCYLRRWRKGRIGAVIGAVALVASAVTVPILLSDTASARQYASQQQALALSNKLAGLAVSNLSTHLGIAQLLAVEATRIDNTPQARAALFQAAGASPDVQRYIPVGAPVSALATSANGTVVVAGTATGNVVRVDLATGGQTEVPAGHGGVTTIGVSADGGTIAALSGSTAVLWQFAAGKHPVAMATPGRQGAVAVSPSGKFAASVSAPVSRSGGVSVVEEDTASGRQQATSVSAASAAAYHPAFTSDSSLMLTSGSGAYVELDTAGLRVLGHSGSQLAPASGYTAGTSADGAYSGYVTAENIQAWQTTIMGGQTLTIAEEDQFHDGISPYGETKSLAFSDDGKWAAGVLNGNIYLSQLGNPLTGHPAAMQLTASNGTSAVSFLGGDHRLVSAAGDELALWNLGGQAEVDAPTGIGVPGLSFAPGTPMLAVSPDGRWLAIEAAKAASIISVSVYHLAASITPAGSWTLGEAPEAMFWRGDQLDFASFNTPSRRLQVTSADGQLIGSAPTAIGTGQIIGAVPADGDRELVMIAPTGVRIIDVQTGASSERIMRIPALSGVTYAEGLSVSPNGASAVLETGGRAVYLDLQTGAGHVVGSGAADATWPTASMLLVERYVAGTADVQEWNATGTHLLRKLPVNGAGGPITVSPNGTMLASVNGQGVASVVDLATGITLATFTLPSSQTSAPDPWGVTAVLFTPDQRQLLTATPGGLLGRFDFGESDLIKVTCTRAGADLTRAEWIQYVGSAPPANLSCLR